MSAEVLGVIPARGGSKAIPRKNLRPVAGVPLVVRTIQSARAALTVTRLVVTTDDGEIRELALRHGAEAPFVRPAELAGDLVPDLPVFQHLLDWLRSTEGYTPDVIVHLRPTAPLRQPRHIDEAVELLLADSEADSVRSITRAPIHPLKMWRMDDGWLVPFVPPEVYNIPEAYSLPRQALPAAFIQNGAVDVIRLHTILDLNSMAGRRIRPYVMEEWCSINVDSPVDLLVADLLARQSQPAHGFDLEAKSST